MGEFSIGDYVAKRTNGYAIASLVLGILGITGPVFLIGPILALVFGYSGKRQIDESAGRENGRGLAVAGIVLGWVGIGLTILFVLLFWPASVSVEHSEFTRPTGFRIHHP